MIFFITQILSLVLVISIVSSFTKNSVLRKTINIIGALFTTLELSSVLLANSLLDYKFYLHLGMENLKSVGGFFFKEGILLVLALIATYYILQFLILQISKIKKYKIVILPLLILIPLIYMFSENGIIYNIKGIITLETAEEIEFNQTIDAIGFQKFIHKKDVKANKGKNVILIILESVETCFLKDNLAHITPNLRKLSKEMNFYEMDPLIGSDFTSAAIYTYLTGMPMVYKRHGNNIFSKASRLESPSIIDAFEDAGYNHKFLVGNGEFAGVKNMLELLGTTVKTSADYDPKLHINYWGLHDKDLFQIAKKEIKELHNENKPFAFTMATISTHHPEGVFDTRILKDVKKQKSNLETMVSAVDYHIGDLMEFLESENILENTSIFIVPDHLLMGNVSSVLKDFENPRNLFLITNEKIDNHTEGENILQIDIPKIILEGANIKNNMTLLSDIINGDKATFVKKNKQKILQYNEAALFRSTEQLKLQQKQGFIQLQSYSWRDEYHGYKSTVLLNDKELQTKRGINLVIQKEKKYTIEHFDTYSDSLSLSSLLTRLEELVHSGTRFFVVSHDSVGKLLKNFKERLEQIGLPILGQIKGRTAYIAISNHGYSSESKNNNTLKLTIPYEAYKSNRTIGKIHDETIENNRFIAHAGGSIENRAYTNSLEAINQSYERGFRLFEIDISKTSDNHYVGTHDWDSWRQHTTYNGPVPVTLDTFVKYKISSKYTALTLDDMNIWFKAHPDALLVTDKINDPKDFAPRFYDKSKLIMELFSIKAAKEAKKMGIKTILAQEEIKNLKGEDKIQALKDLNIEYISASYRIINNNKPFFKKLMDAGIKTYAFHVNHDQFKDESYIVREVMDNCYGMYADNWWFINHNK